VDLGNSFMVDFNVIEVSEVSGGERGVLLWEVTKEGS